MNETLINAAVQVPCMALVCFVVVQFLKYMQETNEAQKESARVMADAMLKMSDSFNALREEHIRQHGVKGTDSKEIS